MRTLALAALTVLLAARPSAADPAPDPAAAASAALSALDEALAALKAPTYRPDQRRLAGRRLEELEGAVARLRLSDADRAGPKAAALERLRRAVVDARARETGFWARPEASAAAELPAETAAPLTRDARAIRAAFAAVVPAPDVPGGPRARPGSAPPPDSGVPPPTAARSAARARRGARSSIADPNAFFDQQAAASGEVAGPDAVAALPGPARGDPPRAPFVVSQPPPRVSDLRTGPVPAPDPAAVPPAVTLRARALVTLDAGTPAARAALTATGDATPVLGPLARGAARPAAPAAPERVSPEKAACLQASGDGPFAGLCGTSSPLLYAAPAAAGFLAELRGTWSLGGAANVFISLLIGFLIPALTGGVGLLFNVLKAILGVTAVLALGALLCQLGSIIYDFATTDASDPRRWLAARRFGAVGAQLLVTVACLLAGVALSRATGAAGAIRSGLTSLQARLTAAGADTAATSGIGAKVAGNRSDIRPPDPPTEETRATPPARWTPPARIALAIKEHLGRFASERGAQTWESFPDKVEWRPYMTQTLANPETRVFFNLDGVDVMEGVNRAASSSRRMTATDWELLQIRSNPDWWPRITWFRGGNPVPNPFE